MKKPKELVKVKWRADRERWMVDYLNPPGQPGPMRSRPLFATELLANAHKLEVLKRLEAAPAPRGGDPNMTLSTAFERYFVAKARKRSLREDRRTAEHLMATFGKPTRLRDLTAGRISAYRERRLAAKSVRRKDLDGKPTPLSAASINRPLALLRHLLRLARDEWEVLEQVPRVKLEREPEGRIRWLEPDEEARLLAACAESGTEHLPSIVTIALESGMRRAEILGLTWERVDLSRGVIRLEVTKSGRRREVPMRQAVYDVLAARPGARQGRVWPDQSIRTAWETAVERAKLDDWHFHDCRHHFASWFMMRGGSLLALSKILGHAKVSMTEKYAHLAPDHLRNEIARTERPVQVLEPISGTNGPASDEESTQVVDSRGQSRGSSEAEQLIRNQ